MIPALLIPLLTTLAQNGLGMLGQAILAKGKDVIEEKLGVDIETSAQTEEGVQILKNLEIKHAEFLIGAALEKQKLDNEAVADARKLQASAIEGNSTLAKEFVYYYAIFWAGISSLYIGFITFGEIPLANVRFADTILGFVLGTLISAPMTYFFGSTTSSKMKDVTIETLSKGKEDGIN